MREITFVEATREALAEAMARDPSIFVVGEGIGSRGGNFTTTLGLYDRFGPERLRDTPIAERGFVGLCTGAAMAGAAASNTAIEPARASERIGRIIIGGLPTVRPPRARGPERRWARLP